MDYVNAVLKMADPEKETSVDLKKLMEAQNGGLLMSIGCRTDGKDENGQWNCIGALKGVEISGDGIITKKSLLDHSCKSNGLKPKEEQRNLAFTLD